MILFIILPVMNGLPEWFKKHRVIKAFLIKIRKKMMKKMRENLGFLGVGENSSKKV